MPLSVVLVCLCLKLISFLLTFPPLFACAGTIKQMLQLYSTFFTGESSYIFLLAFFLCKYTCTGHYKADALTLLPFLPINALTFSSSIYSI